MQILNLILVILLIAGVTIIAIQNNCLKHLENNYDPMAKSKKLHGIWALFYTTLILVIWISFGKAVIMNWIVQELLLLCVGWLVVVIINNSRHLKNVKGEVDKREMNSTRQP